MIVVSDTTPLNYLILLDAAHVLPPLFGRVYAPSAVIRELAHRRSPELLSKRGASHKLLSLVGVSDRFQINLSVPLVFEYEHALKRQSDSLGLAPHEIDDVLNYLCSVARRRRIFFLWRTFLRDPKDEFVLELAVEAGCELIITDNQSDFTGIERFGLRSMTPREFLRKIEIFP